MNQDKLKGLISEGKVDKAFAHLYRFYPKVERHIRRNSGSREEALDVFQDALIIFYRKISTVSRDEKMSVEGFLHTTCKLLWSNELRKKGVRKRDSDGLFLVADGDEIDVLIQKERKIALIEGVLNGLGEKCRQILEMFYYRKQSMETIAAQFGFGTVASAKVQKYKCLESARNATMEKVATTNNTTETYEDRIVID